MSLSLVKIPFVLLTAYGFHRCMSPPNKAPPKQEQYFPKTGSARIFEVAVRFVLSLGDVLDLVQWGIALFECAAIYGAANPSSPVSHVLASYLSFNNVPLSHLDITRPTLFFAVSCIVTYAGYSFRILAFHTLGKMFTFELSKQRDHRLVTDGPYSIVRHPSYIGGIVGFFGHAGCALGSHSWLRQSGVLGTIGGILFVGFWILGMSALLTLLMVRVRGEDDMMHAAFGDEWEKWAERVRYRLIPGVY